MQVKKYRKKPIEIEAIQWNGKNLARVVMFMGKCKGSLKTNQILIDTLEGTMAANVGDYIIKGIKGEFYPCKPDVFKATYEEC